MGAEVLSGIGVLLLMMTDSVIPVTEDMGELTFVCPDGWTIQAPNCYLITPSRRDFMSAEETCQKYGANLVILEDEAESLSLSKLVRQTSSSIDTFWIGNIHDGQSVCGGVWDIMQPADLNSTYVSSRASNGRWSTTDPDMRQPYVCKLHACVEGTFHCSNGPQCLNDALKCDGMYDCSDQSDEADCELRPKPTPCTSYIQKPSGSLNVTYEANRPCTWVIEGVVGQTLSITFHTVDLERYADYIEVWSGGPTIETSTLKASYTGNLTDQIVYGDNNFLLIRLFSDNSVEGTGFTATWQTDPELSSEERMVEATDSWTEVTSPHYNNSQRPSVYFRQFTVNTTDGSHITMEIMDNQLMVDDFVYDPQELSSIVSSSSGSPLVFVSLGSNFTFQISSMGNDTRAFRARVKRGCLPDVTLTSGIIESPGPTPIGPYPSSLICTYTVRAPSDHPRGFMISFVSFKLADNNDNITVYNVTDSVSNQMYISSQYTMSSQLPQHLYSGSVFVMKFTSSLAQSDGYFALNFTRDCPAVADTSNMILSTTLSHAFSFVNITCNTGYSFAQEEFNNTWVSMTCSQDGNWDKPRMPTCRQTYCGVPQSIANGEIYTGSGNARYGATVNYRCFPGFSRNGSSTSTCQENGQWTNPPECHSATCPPPPTIINGNLTFINGTSNSSADRQYFGAIVKYTCNPGYDLIGSSYSLCYSAIWSMQPPVCQAIKCPVPEVDRATLSTQNPVELGMSLNITCNPGYTNNGTDSFQSTCTSSGMFDVPRNICQDKNECDTGGICGSHQTCHNTDGNFTCVCEKGYILTSGTCQDIDECANNTSGCDVTNGYCNNTSGGFTCLCNSGYTLYTQNSTTGKYIPLSEDGLRQGDVYYINHTCVPVTCPSLPSISHGTLLSASTSYVYNETAKYRCDWGYTLTGAAVVTCQSNGTWSALPPTCSPRYCAPLAPTGNVSTVIPQNITVIGDKVTLVCKSEVGSEYNKTLYCTYDSLTDNMTLQGDSPNCPAIDCGSPSLVATGGSVSISTSSGLGKSFEFSCAPGFNVTGMSTLGNTTVRCGENGRWGFGTLYCAGQRCKDPGTPGGMNMTSASFDVNGVVTFTCLRPGYVARPQTRTCVYENGQAKWNGSTPVCVDTERPVFSNCPTEVIYRNIYTSAAFAMPSATDNSGLVLPLKVSPPGFRLDMRLAESLNVTFTASDVTGNNATCQVAIVVRDPRVFPELTCPDRVQYSVSNSTSYTVDLQTDGNVTGVNLTFSPSRMVKVGPTTVGAAPYYVTTTDMYGFQRQCAFMVDIRLTACLSDYLSPGGATKQCTSQAGGNLTCSVTCSAGMTFQDGSTTKTYSCSGQNLWSPTLPARSCTPMVISQYIYTFVINYNWNGTGDLIACLNQSLAELVAAIPTRRAPCPIGGGLPGITFNASVVSLDKNEANLVLELTVTNLPVPSSDLSYCAGTLSVPNSELAETFFDISSTTCTGQTGAVTFTPQNRNLTRYGYVCPRGTTLLPVGKQYFCVQCEPGYMENGGQCIECPSGQYQNQTGQTECKACAGNFSSSPRVSASQCVESCPLGFVNGQGGAASPPPCYACPVDTYLDMSYTANCTSCPSGSTTFGTRGASSSAQCKACPPGEYPVNSTSCSPCPRGYYKTSTGYTKCTECPANTTTISTGSSASTNCTSLTPPVCLNGGTPVIYFHEYTCTCPEGYYGTTCGNWTNPCASNPCYNNGVCSPQNLSYTCSCSSGFTGNQCEVDAQNNCQSNTCSDISFCRDKINSADCVCPSGGNYTGPQCAVPMDLCSPNPCKNGATCQNFGPVRYTCQCLPGYTGSTCETLIDQCALNSHGCLYGGQCINGINNYTCSCKQSYQGSHCQQTPDYCNLSNPCPSGVCYNDYSKSMAQCACSYPYRLNATSSRCEEIDVCSGTSPCQNNATCQRVSPGQFHCACLRGYVGSLCQHIDRSCTNSSCVHGQCIDVLNNYTCVCDPGYTGRSCDVNMDDCPGQCVVNNTLTFVDGVNQCTCSCKPGFTGVHCEININECASLPCKHNGTCVESATPGDYSCTCRDGWTGKNCDTLPDFCRTNFCQNGGKCYNLQDTHFCSCQPGTHGKSCNETSNICTIVSPCVNPNQCQSDNGTASCNCSQNYTGGSCQLETDFCSTNPCPTDQCVTTDVGDSCQCQGTNDCTATHHSCASKTCPSGSSCVETASGPLCLCQPGYLLGGDVCKNTSSDFDIYFTRGSNTKVRALQPFTVTGQALSLTFWISFLEDSSSFPVQLLSDRMDPVLLVSQSGVSFGGTFAVNFTDYNGGPQSLSAGHKWTFCAITWNMAGQCNIYINSVQLPNFSGIPNGTFPSLGSLLFPYIGEGFVGYISQLNVWNRALTRQEALTLYNNVAATSSLAPAYRWSEYQFNSWVKVISPSNVKRDKAMCQMRNYDNECVNDTVKTPPVTNCSTTDVNIPTYRQIQLFDHVSPNAIFPGDDLVFTNMNGTLLTFGAYHVVYASKDTAGNVATCRFNVYVQREGHVCNAGEADYGDSTLTSCGAQPSLGESVTCPVNTSVTPFTPKVLTCGKLGSYNLDEPYSLPPAQPCSDFVDIQVLATLILKYQLGISCGDTESTQIKSSLQNKVENLAGTWPKLCNNNNCDSVNVNVVCNSNTATASLIFHDLPPRLTSGNVTYTVTELLKVSAIEQDTFNVNFVANADLIKDEITVTLQTTCRQGYGRFGAGCVQCVSGSFLNFITNMCELCAVGTYTNTSGQARCTQCPQNQTTLRVGSVSCVEECSEGRYYNTSNNACQPCFKNFYQPNKGRSTCFPCPPNTFTEGPGTIYLDKCRAACPPGSDMQGTSCVPCVRGSYRTGLVEDDKCQDCPAGNTTATTNSTSSTDCSQPACFPGYYRNATTNQCELCHYGYYQPEQWQDNCIPCNTDYTTNNTGSTSSSACIFVCPAGSQDSGNHICQPCPRGFYRANSLQDRFLGCTACNTSFTTVTTGSTSSSDCNITACSPGHMRDSITNQCLQCDYSYYQPNRWQDMCLPCNTSYTTNNTGSTSPSDCKFVCPPGYEDPGNQTCQPCQQGYFRSNSIADRFQRCTACNATFTTAGTGSTSSDNCTITACSPGYMRNSSTNKCVECNYGYYQPLKWQDMCIQCNANYTTANTSSTNAGDCRFVCPPGYEDPGNQTCQPCQQGYFRSNSIADRFQRCTACNATFTTAGTGSTSSDNCTITACSPGYMRNSSTNKCVECNYGYYQPLKWQDMCIQCNANYTTANTSSTNAGDCRFYCQAGYEVQAPGVAACSPCPRGMFKTNYVDDKLQACQNCSSGMTTDSTATVSASLCNIKVCTAGQVIVNSLCVPCPANFYQNETVPFSYTKCTACPTGRGTRQDGQTSQAACLPMCGPGQQYNSTVNQCVACPQGTWNSGNTSQQFDPCAPCPVTYVTVGEGATSADNCTLKDCPPGEYIATNDSCKPCPIGTYQDARRQYNCTSCPAHTNTSTEGITDVRNCTVFCDVGQEQKSKTENCTSCLPDFIKNFAGYGLCTQCTGNFTSNEARTMCDVLYCDKGFRPNTGGSCDPCGVGFYKDQRGNSSCVQCPANSTTASVASTSINNCNIAFCEPGLYSVTNQLPCLPCPLGTYKNETGNQNCFMCPADRTTPHIGSVTVNSCSLVVCPAGQFRNIINVCQDCDTGYYQSQPGQTTCQLCGANYTTDTKASTSPENCTINCPPGQYRDTRTSCQKCVVGSYQPNYGASSCINCTTNFITAGSGSTNSSDCFISCGPGSYRPSDSKTECRKCPLNQYQNVSNATECKNCSADFFTQQVGSTLETDCLPKCRLGEYLNISARTCFPCPVGTYNQIGSSITECTPCPENMITIGTGAQSVDACNITDCVWGQYRVNGGCMNCMKGWYQPEKSQDSCIQCPPGNTTLLTGQIYESSCIDDCADGTAYNMVDNKCEQCIIGYYRKKTETMGCIKCSPGKTTLSQGASSCVDSVTGTTSSPFIQRYVVTVTIRMQIKDCSNTVQLTAAIRKYILKRLQSADLMFPALCAGDCQADLRFRFIGGCLSSSQRKKRDLGQDVELQLHNVTEEISGNDSGQNVTAKALAVIARAFYDTTQDALLLDENKLTFDGVIDATIRQLCNPGQHLQNITCVDCSAGYFSTDGASSECTPCKMDTYQEASGQTSCKPCSAKAYTSTTASTSSSNCTKLCDRPNARQTYCSDHGTCVFDETTDNGVMCKCDDNWSSNDCNTRQAYEDKQIPMIAGIIGGLAGFLVLVLLVVGIVMCMKRATKQKKNKELLQDDMYSDMHQSYNTPLRENHALPQRSIMYLNPSADDDVIRPAPSIHSSRKRSNSYEANWKDLPELKTHF